MNLRERNSRDFGVDARFSKSGAHHPQKPVPRATLAASPGRHSSKTHLFASRRPGQRASMRVRFPCLFFVSGLWAGAIEGALGGPMAGGSAASSSSHSDDPMVLRKRNIGGEKSKISRKNSEKTQKVNAQTRKETKKTVSHLSPFGQRPQGERRFPLSLLVYHNYTFYISNHYVRAHYIYIYIKYIYGYIFKQI